MLLFSSFRQVVIFKTSSHKTREVPLCIIGTGTGVLHINQFILVCDGKVTVKAGTLREGMVCLIACYYIFNIPYPKTAKAVFHFIEKFLLEIKNGKKLQNSILGIISSIDKL